MLPGCDGHYYEIIISQLIIITNIIITVIIINSITRVSRMWIIILL